MADNVLPLPLVGGEAKRRCRKCWIAKSLDEFERKGSDRRRARICKACANSRRDPIDNRQRVKEWQKANPEKKRAQSRRNYESRRADITRWLARTLSTTRAHCSRKEIPFATTAEGIVELFGIQSGICALTSRELIWGSNGVQRDSLSLDRIEPSLGYVPGNIRLVTYQANMARGPYPDDELFAFCEAVLATRAAGANE